MREFAWLAVVVLLTIAFHAWAYSYDKCDRAQLGVVQVSKARFNRVEVCDGKTWRPLDIRPGMLKLEGEPLR